MTSALAGSAMVVARWKYQAIGNASASWMTVEMNSNSAAPRTKPAPRTTTKLATPTAEDVLELSRGSGASRSGIAPPASAARNRGGRVEIPERPLQRINAAPQDGDRNAGHRDHRQECELEAGFEQGPRIDQQNPQRRDAEPVKRGTIAEQQPRAANKC